MRAHVFIVNDQTFPSHLQYLFAGTGAKDKDEDIDLLADISRVRAGDLVIFYIEGTMREKGGFYGIFKIAEQNPLVFQTTGAMGFEPNLGKKLIYRTLIEPYEVYSSGVPEWEALDKLPVFAKEIQWTLIYRKLKGKRGCTPLLPWEAKRLVDMLRDKNAGAFIAQSGFQGGFDWDSTNRRIITTESRRNYPFPRALNFNVLQWICEKERQGQAYEMALQLYFTQNIGIDPKLNSIAGAYPLWFANEVPCGVGMQKIDLVTICEDNGRTVYRLIELKDDPVEIELERTLDQIEYYAQWASEKSGGHFEGAYEWNIQPIVVAPPNRKNWLQVQEGFRSFNQKRISLPIKYFEFRIDCGRSITFTERPY